MSVPQNVTPRNADQERFVRYLAERVRQQLSGEAARFIERVRPSRTLQLGILPPLDPIDPPPTLADKEAEPEPHEPADGDFNGRPPTMGLDFCISPASDGTAAVRVSGGFSVYVQRYPTIDEQKAFWQTAVPAPEIRDRESDCVAAEAPVTGDAAAMAADHIGDEDSGNGMDDSSPPAKRRGRRPVMSLFPKYERIDIEIPPTDVPLDPSRPHDMIPLRDAAQAAVDRALTPILADPKTVHAFEGNQTVPLMSSPATRRRGSRP